MTREELAAIEAVVSANGYLSTGDDFLPANDVLRLVARVRRLSALIVAAEWSASVETPFGDAACPWCSAENGMRTRNAKHSDSCPAFMADGTLR